MKFHRTLLILKIFILLLVPFIFLSCSSVKVSEKSKDYFDQVTTDAAELIQKGENEKAEAILLKAASTQKPVSSPFVENNSLCFYADNAQQTFSSMLTAASFSIAKEKDSLRNNPAVDEELVKLYEKSPWKNAIVLPASYPRIYFMLGVVKINRKKYMKAIAYLDTATFIWKGLALAWSEKMYAYMSIGQMDRAEKIGLEALEIKEVKMDEHGQAAILRKLGYIAVEKDDLDEAENYYNKSIKLDENQVALDELKYIKDLKKQRK